jgi:hypothetical protein
MVHPHSELRYVSDNVGYGVVATRLIPRGTITWVADELDQVVSTDSAECLPPLLKPLLEKYAWVNGKGQLILCWDHARFINHSCEANCLSIGFDFEIAVRDIHPGEQLTDEYGTLNLSEPFRCHCGSARCRGVVHPDDILRYAEVWDSLARAAFVQLKTVEQPLWPLLVEEREVEEALAGKSPLPSCLRHYVRRHPLS